MKRSYVIDVNILFSALISKKPFYEVLFSNFDFYVPDFALIELQKYNQVILKRLPQFGEMFKKFTLSLFSQLKVFPTFLIDRQIWTEAEQLCEKIDPKDTPYVALAMFLQIPFLTRDKQCYNGLYDNRMVDVVLFDDFYRQQFG